MGDDKGERDTGLSILGDKVVVKLRQMIASGAIGPGERMVERELADRLGTSRGPIRDAIRTLQHEGLVEITPYAGACAAQIDRDEIDEIVALRRQVEYFAIAGATLRADADEIGALRALADEMGPAFAAGDVDVLMDLDLRFHLDICAASRHATLAVVMRTLYPRLAVLMHPQMLASHDAASFSRQHHELVDAIEGGSVEASLRAMDDHIDSFMLDLELRIDDGRARPAYLDEVTPARPVAVRRRLGTLD